MAGLKKKKKDKSGSPNVTLVVFLVLFVLVSIGLGVFAYYGYAGQEDLRNKAARATASAKEENRGRKYYSMLWRDLRSALGEPLDAKETEQRTIDLEDFLRDENGGAFKDETDKETARKLIEKLKKQLGVTDNGKDYKSKLNQELSAADAKIKDLEGKLATALVKNQRFEAFSAQIIANRDQFQQDISGKITKGNAAALAEAQKRTDEFKAATDLNSKLKKDLDDKQEELTRLSDDKDKVIRTRDTRIKVLTAELKEFAAAGGAVGANLAGAGRPGGDAFPLILDISTGKPLWDAPVGKISRVDLDLRQVTINLGSAHGVVPELTFNIFGAGTSGRAEKQMKGSIEVIKVIDTTTSLARITSLYDSSGQEIMMNLQTRGRLQRESEAPVREGDLLFNLFWGTRVAVTGYVSITGEASDNPAEQYRQMEDFMHLLRRNGMQVDAFVDLRDGQIKGRITPTTRYLIYGENLRVLAGKAKAPDDEKEKDAGEKNGQPNTDRNDAVNKASFALRKDAIDRGLLLINHENFATVIGYRKARNLNNTEPGRFNPGLPYAGEPRTGVVVLPDNRKDEDKKDAPKDAPKEKKDDN